MCVCVACAEYTCSSPVSSFHTPSRGMIARANPNAATGLDAAQTVSPKLQAKQRRVVKHVYLQLI